MFELVRKVIRDSELRLNFNTNRIPTGFLYAQTVTLKDTRAFCEGKSLLTIHFNRNLDYVNKLRDRCSRCASIEGQYTLEAFY